MTDERPDYERLNAAIAQVETYLAEHFGGCAAAVTFDDGTLCWDAGLFWAGKGENKMPLRSAPLGARSTLSPRLGTLMRELRAVRGQRADVVRRAAEELEAWLLRNDEQRLVKRSKPPDDQSK